MAHRFGWAGRCMGVGRQLGEAIVLILSVILHLIEQQEEPISVGFWIGR